MVLPSEVLSAVKNYVNQRIIVQVLTTHVSRAILSVILKHIITKKQYAKKTVKVSILGAVGLAYYL